MDDTLAAILDELHVQGREFDATKADRLDRLRNLEPETARVLALLVRSRPAPRVLELGTSNGYSTLWLADAARSAGGSVVSVDLDAERSAMAAANLRRAGLDELVELRTQDAGAALGEAADASLDVVFMDSERPAYPGYWPDLLRAIVPGGLLCVDNVLSHADEVAPFRELVAAEPRVHEALVPTGAGLLLVVRDREAGAQ